MSFRILLLMGALAFVGARSEANTGKCEPLIKDLKAMQQAQTSLLKSLTRKNESMAQTLDQFGKSFETLANQNKSVRRADVLGLKISAKAFREHGLREDQLVKKFETASQQLLAEVESCLAAKPTVAQTKN